MANETAFPLDYDGLRAAFERCALDVDALADLLSDGWAAGYRATTAGEVELVEVEQEKLTFLFDVAYARVVGVYGSSGPPRGEYPTARMRGFPLPQTEP